MTCFDFTSYRLTIRIVFFPQVAAWNAQPLFAHKFNLVATASASTLAPMLFRRAAFPAEEEEEDFPAGNSIGGFTPPGAAAAPATQRRILQAAPTLIDSDTHDDTDFTEPQAKAHWAVEWAHDDDASSTSPWTHRQHGHVHDGFGHIGDHGRGEHLVGPYQIGQTDDAKSSAVVDCGGGGKDLAGQYQPSSKHAAAVSEACVRMDRKMQAVMRASVPGKHKMVASTRHGRGRGRGHGLRRCHGTAPKGTAGTFAGRRPPKDPERRKEFNLIRDWFQDARCQAPSAKNKTGSRPGQHAYVAYMRGVIKEIGEAHPDCERADVLRMAHERYRQDVAAEPIRAAASARIAKRPASRQNAAGTEAMTVEEGHDIAKRPTSQQNAAGTEAMTVEEGHDIGQAGIIS